MPILPESAILMEIQKQVEALLSKELSEQQMVRQKYPVAEELQTSSSSLVRPMS